MTAHGYPSSPGSSWTEHSTKLTAALDDPNADLHIRACAFEELAKAAREVAKQLDNDGQRSAASAPRDVRKIITGPTSAICDECIHDLCVEVLDEEHGDD